MHQEPYLPIACKRRCGNLSISPTTQTRNCVYFDGTPGNQPDRYVRCQYLDAVAGSELRPVFASTSNGRPVRYETFAKWHISALLCPSSTLTFTCTLPRIASRKFCRCSASPRLPPVFPMSFPAGSKVEQPPSSISIDPLVPRSSMPTP